MYSDQGEGARNRGRGTRLTHWVGDLRLGVRLAIGGGRTSKTGVARLVLGTIGIGLAVAVLLVGASAGPMFNARNDRENAQVERIEPVAGVDPLFVAGGTTRYRDHTIVATYVSPSGPRAPLPPGVDRLPRDGEVVLSPALATLLASPEGHDLRPRFPQQVISTIGRVGVTDADTLSFYAGDGSIDESTARMVVYGYGQARDREMPPELALLIAIGTVVLLVPVFVFIATSARIAGTERDRRLAALRLIGVDARQARRIAAAESLASAGTGLAFGVGLFVVFRSLVGNFPVLGVRAYPSDVTPPWPLAVLIVLLVPLIAVVTAQVALRRTIIEPLGVVRSGKPTRRRLWWRLVPLVLGPILLLSQDSINRYDTRVPIVVAGSALLLLGIPALLPWLLERAVARLRGGRPAMQLAIRRLQLDSGTPARVVGGVAVVLAGAIALDAVLASQTKQYDLPSYLISSDIDSMVPAITISTEGVDPDAVGGSVRGVPGVQSTVQTRQFSVEDDRDHFNAVVVECPVLLRYGVVPSCVDGEVFGINGSTPPAGKTVNVVDYTRSSGTRQVIDQWTVPVRIGQATRTRYTEAAIGYFSLLVTPGAVKDLRDLRTTASIAVFADRGRPDILEGVRTATAPYGWRARVESNERYASQSQTFELFLTVQNGLLGGALFTLLLAGISMLVLALEQMRERRRPLAALAATGVPTGTLARSLLWQNAVPVLIAVLVAVLTGIGLAELVFRLIDEPFSMDWLSVALYSGAATALVLLVTAMIMPTLRGATRLAALRME